MQAGIWRNSRRCDLDIAFLSGADLCQQAVIGYCDKRTYKPDKQNRRIAQCQRRSCNYSVKYVYYKRCVFHDFMGNGLLTAPSLWGKILVKHECLVTVKACDSILYFFVIHPDVQDPDSEQ